MEEQEEVAMEESSIVTVMAVTAISVSTNRFNFNFKFDVKVEQKKTNTIWHPVTCIPVPII